MDKDEDQEQEEAMVAEEDDNAEARRTNIYREKKPKQGEEERET